jgi:uncharacterized protein YukE
VVTYAQLRAAKPAAWAGAAYEYRSAAATVAEQWGEVVAQVAEVDDAWRGQASERLLARLLAQRDALAAAFPALISIDQALSEFAEAVTLAQAVLATVAPPPGSGITIDIDGTVHVASAGDPTTWAHGAAAVTAGVVRALDLATRADAEAAARLAVAVAGFDPARQRPPAYVPAPGTTPAAVAAWWAGLSADERRWEVVQDGVALTALAGVPADARDQAARFLLYRQRAALRQRAAALRAAGAAGRGELASVDAALDGVGATLARLDADGGPRAYLLRLDPGHNDVVVSVGDPDRAGSVVTFVGGVGSGLPAAATEVTWLDAIAGAGDAAAPTSETAVVGWFDYAAPATLTAATSDRAARQAVVPLTVFEQGLRATHDGAPAHDSLLGYSYGSTVAGVTARDAAPPVDDIVLVGSPGADVDSAARLHVAPGHVWATVATNDAIRFAVDPLGRFLGAFGIGHRDAMWFGTAPTSPAFGAHVFRSDPGSFWHPARAHEAYFDPGSVSLENIARIVTGDGADVS